MSDLLYRSREAGNSWLLELKRLEVLEALRYFASAPGAAEIYRPLPLVSPPKCKLDEDPCDESDGGGVSECPGVWLGRGMPIGLGEEENPRLL